MEPIDVLAEVYARLFFNDLNDAPADHQAFVDTLATAVEAGTVSLAQAEASLVEEAKGATGAIAAAYQFLTGKVPSEEGFEFLVNAELSGDFGAFNVENRFINQMNALVQGNPTAIATFNFYASAEVPGDADLIASITKLYDAVTNISGEARDAAIEFLTRPEALAFYRGVAEERILSGSNPADLSLDQAAAVIALGSIVNIAVREGTPGLGGDIDAMLEAIASGDSPLHPTEGTDVSSPDSVTLTEGTDVVSGEVFDAPRGFTPGGTDQVNTLNSDDVLTGVGENTVLNFTYVLDADTGDHDISPTLNNINTLNINIQSPANMALDLQDSSGVEDINVNGIDDSNFRIYNIQDAAGDGNGLNLSVSNSNDENSSVEFLFVNAAVNGDSDVVNLEVSNVDLLGLRLETTGTQHGVEMINLTSSSSANMIDVLQAEDLRTLNIDGDAELQLGDTATTVRPGGQIEGFRHFAGLANVAGSLTMIDASGLAAPLDITLGAEVVADLDGTSGTPVDLQVIGTASDDTFRMLNGADSAGDMIDGGDGRDTVQVFADVVDGTFTSLEHLDIRGGQDNNFGADTITVDAALFDALEDITIRNEGQSGGVTGTETLTTVLNNLTAEQAETAITVQHSTTGSNDYDDNIIIANLATDTADDTVGLTIVDQNDGEDRGINTDPRFNVALAAADVENVTLTDEDSESNTVVVVSDFPPLAGGPQNTFAGDLTGTLTVLGEDQAGNFLNLDAGPVLIGGALAKDVSGGDVDGPRILDAGNGSAIRFIGETVDASAYTGDLIVRVADNTALPSGAQTILGGSGDDHIIFDALNNTTAGLTISDTVNGGDGFDTLYLDGHGTLVNISASEWTNVSNIEAIHLIGQNVAGTNDAYGNNSYNLTLTNDLINANGEEMGGGRLIHIINDNNPDNEDLVTDIATGWTRGVTIDARTLAANRSFTYDGEEGISQTADRFIMADANINGMAVIDGGAVDVNGASNNDVLEVRNAAVITIGDLANVSNVGTINFTNDTAALQESTLVLDAGTIDRLVNDLHDAFEDDGGDTVEVLDLVISGNAIGGAPTVVNLQDNLTAGDRDDVNYTVLVTGTAPVTVRGVDPSVVIQGNAEDNHITADNNDNIIDGGAGNDQLFGLGGNDLLIGGTGADILTGGTGANVFRFNNGDSFAATAFNSNAGGLFLDPEEAVFGNGVDVITDFVSGTDTIDLEHAFTAGDIVPTLDDFPDFGILDNQIAFVTGTWNAATQTFTSDAGGTDQLIVYDADGTAGVSEEAIVLLNSSAAITDFV